MLKIGKVYLYKDDFYLFICEKRKYDGKVSYLTRKVLTSGKLSKKFFRVKYTKSNFSLTDFGVDITINIPVPNVNKIHYDNLVQMALVAVKRFNRWEKSEDAIEIGRLAWASVGIYNTEKQKFPTIKDFGEHLLDLTWATFYKCIDVYASSLFTKEKYQFALPDSADTTIMGCIFNYQLFGKSYLNISKRITKLVMNDIKEYNKHLRLRGLNMADYRPPKKLTMPMK